MPTSRSGRKLLALIATFGLGGCLDGTALSPAGPEATRISVAGGSVAVAAPAGYCVDRRLTRTVVEEAFVVLGSCAALRRGAGPAGVPVLLTATVATSPAATPIEPAAIERFIRSEAGRASISRAGQAETVRVLQTLTRDGALFVRLRDLAVDERARPVASDYWRAILAVNGHLVTLTAQPFADMPTSDDAGLAVLAEFARGVRAASATPVASDAPRS